MELVQNTAPILWMLMSCPECERLLAEFDRREETYFDALGRAGADPQRVNPNHYFRLRKAVQDARQGLYVVVEDLYHHQDAHALVQ